MVGTPLEKAKPFHYVLLIAVAIGRLSQCMQAFDAVSPYAAKH